ncbi:TonB-dependent receptor P3 [subsurface metagenome]
MFQRAPQSKHHLSFNGGNENTTYQASFSYFSQDGIIGGDKSNFKRYTARLNSQHKLKPWLDAGTNIAFTHLKRNLINENQEYGGLVSNSIFLDPTTPEYYSGIDDIPEEILNTMIYQLFDGDSMRVVNSTVLQDEKGYFGVSSFVKNEIRNPTAQLHNTHTTYAQDRLLAGGYFNINPLKGLQIHSQLDFDLIYGKYHAWYPATLWNVDVYDRDSSVIENIEKNFIWQWENYVTYSNQIKKHNFTLLVGTTVREARNSFVGAYGQFMQSESDDFAHVSSTLSDTVVRAASGMTNPPDRLISYFGRASYNYAEKYLLEFIIRRDGSSRFTEANRFGTFPSISGGWIVSREDFWPFSIVNYFKLRGSWGQNGSLSNLRNHGYLSTISIAIGAADGQYTPIYMLDANGNMITGAQPTALSNIDMIWETSEQTDIGFDLGMLQNQLSFSFDYYIKKTIDQLVTSGTPAYVGGNPPFRNLGSIDNSGIELEVSYKKLFNELQLTIAANAAYLKNEVDFIGKEGGELLGASITGQTITKFTPGYPAWYIYGYKTNGIFQNWEEIDNYTNEEGELLQLDAMPGDLRLVDTDADGDIDQDDRTYLGSPWPDWTFGFTTNLGYKGFDFTMFWSASLGNELYNGYHRRDLSNANLPREFYAERWIPDNPTNDMFRATYNKGDNLGILDFYVEDASWLKLRTLSLGYSLPARLFNKIPIEHLRIFLSAQNVLTFTKYSGMDPEVGNTDNTQTLSNSIGVDRGFYPSARLWMAGINVSF